MTKPRKMVLFAFDGCQLLDVAGPSSVFGIANHVTGRPLYDVKVVSPRGGLVATSCGVSIATLSTGSVSPRTVDTVFLRRRTAAMHDSIALAATRRWL